MSDQRCCVFDTRKKKKERAVARQPHKLPTALFLRAFRTPSRRFSPPSPRFFDFARSSSFFIFGFSAALRAKGGRCGTVPAAVFFISGPRFIDLFNFFFEKETFIYFGDPVLTTKQDERRGSVRLSSINNINCPNAIIYFNCADKWRY